VTPPSSDSTRSSPRSRSATWDGGRGFTWADGARRFEPWENSYVTTHDLGTRRCAIVTAKIAGHSADDIAAALGRAGINVSATVAQHNPLDTEERGVHPLVRFSPHYYNTEAEIDRTLAAVAELASAGSCP
jgi:selenocysteine lyase/cysteine desulfurase